MFTLIDAWTGEAVQLDSGEPALYDTQPEAEGAALWLGYAGLVVGILKV